MSQTPDTLTHAADQSTPTEESWPAIGIAVPTVDNADQACQAMQAFLDHYPGKVVFAVVANGTTPKQLAKLRQFAGRHMKNVLLTELEENKGYAIGCNVGLEALSVRGGFAYYGVTNDDVLPSSTCLTELVAGMRELTSLGHNPGLIGPVSNSINGSQQRNIGEYSNPAELEARCAAWYAEHHESVTQVFQLRGLMLLIHPDCLKAVGGFDPCFGIGNFEDDDLNLRARLAGFTLWVADGAFLHHYGSTTFKKLGIDYRANIERNAETFVRKWRLGSLEEWPTLEAAPEGVSLYCPLGQPVASPQFAVRVNGETIDLIEQASDVEFAAWVMRALAERPRRDRLSVVACVAALSEAA